jgi:hypothetical protein
VIPDDVRRFILTSIPSVPHIEALLLMRREPQEAWSKQRIALRLYISEEKASELLNELANTGLISAEAGNAPIYRYAPSGAQSKMVDQVADAYARSLVEVTNMIHGRSVARVQEFAEAFRFRKD